MKTVSLIMSAYDEENTVGVVLEKLRKLDYLYEIVIVNNGSNDSTYDIMLDAQKKDDRIKLYSIEKNRGLGCGIKLAIENTSGEIVVRQDADLEYDPNELINLVKIIDKDLADVVYGSRLLVKKAHRVHYYYSYLANKIITMFANIITNLFLSDIETAAKAFRGDVVRQMNWVSKGFEIEIEMVIKFKRVGCEFYEIPFSYYGRSFNQGKKIRPIDGFKAIFYIFYYWIRSFISKPTIK
jgi:glycosyltransferase involved in cell wall biosynthesis